MNPKRTGNLFLVFGEDEFIVEQAVRRLIRQLAGRIGCEPEVATIDVSEISVEDFIGEILSPSLFAQNRISVLRHFALAGRSNLILALEDLLSQELPAGQFIILAPEKVDKRLRLYKLLERSGDVIELPALGHDGLVEWIVDRFKELGKTASRSVAEVLLDLKGEDDTRVLDSEVEKVSTYAGRRSRIEIADVEEVVGKTKTEHVFELIHQVTAGDVTSAFETFNGLLATGESPLGVVFLLAREVKALIQVRLFLRDSGIRLERDPGYNRFVRDLLPPFRDWIEHNRVPERDTFIRQKPYAVYRRFVEAIGFELRRLVDLLDALVEINAALVSTSISPRILIENFILSMGRCEKVS